METWGGGGDLFFFNFGCVFSKVKCFDGDILRMAGLIDMKQKRSA